MKIAIGGFIGSGKSSVAQILSQKLDFPWVPEYTDVEMFEHLLNLQNNNHYLGSETFQFYTLMQASKRQMQYVDRDYIMDRDIIEHKIFSNETFKNSPIEASVYDILWGAYFLEIQRPSLYVILTVDWKYVVDRIYKRYRRAEIENLDRTLIPMQKLHETYTTSLKEMCDALDIPAVFIDTNKKTPEQNANEILSYLKDFQNKK
jgi:deoxyadenosine/deoxycytidine kinase